MNKRTLVLSLLFIPLLTANAIERDQAQKAFIGLLSQAHVNAVATGPGSPRNLSPQLAAPNISALDLRSLLQQRRYAELNEQLAGYRASVEEDIAAEERLFEAYDAFQSEDETLGPLYDAWVATSPDAPEPYLARAKLFYRLAFRARGGKWATETSEQQFARMDEYFERALEDVLSSLQRDERSLVAFAMLIDIATTQGREEDAYRYFRKALHVAPASYRARRAYIRCLEPRWGGSMEAMTAFAIESQAFSDANPRIALLQGHVLSYAGWLKYRDDAHNAAEELYDAALSHGDNHEILFRRAINRYRQERYGASLADLDRAIELSANDAEYHEWRSWANQKLGNDEDAARDVARALALNPVSESIRKRRDSLVSRLERRGYDLREARKPAAAVAKFDLALGLAPNRASLYERRARARIQLNEHESATADVKRSIELDPDDFGAHKLLDWLLAQRRDWEQIIDYWSQYIARNPNDSRAYVERGGAYFHKGDRHAAVADAKIAAEMGNLQGKQAYERFGTQGAARSGHP